MWTWLITELEYRKNMLIGALLFCVLAPPGLTGTLVLLDVSERTLRSVYMMYAFMALVPVGIVGSTGYLREEMRGLLISPMPLKSVSVGSMRLGYTLVILGLYGISILIASLLAVKLGIEVAWWGLLAFFLFDMAWMAYSLVIEHFADYTRQTFLFFALLLPMLIPMIILMSLFILPSTETKDPLFSFFAHPGWILLFSVLSLLFTLLLLLVAKSGHNHRVVLGNFRYGGM